MLGYEPSINTRRVVFMTTRECFHSIPSLRFRVRVRVRVRARVRVSLKGIEAYAAV